MKKVIIASLFLCVIITLFHPRQVAAVNDDYKKSNIDLYIDGENVSEDGYSLIMNNRLLFPARSTLRTIGGLVYWYKSAGRAKILKGSTLLDIYVDSKNVYINGVFTKMDTAPIVENGELMIPIRFAAENLGREVHWDGENKCVYIGEKPDFLQITAKAPLIESQTEQETDIKREMVFRDSGSKFRVVIDAGHGDKDTGAAANSLIEKNVNLDMALKLDKILKERGIKTYMTRVDDSYPDLYSRAYYANRVNADLFISIHNNAVFNTNYHGTMTLYYPYYGRFTGYNLASIVQEELVKALGSRNLGKIPRSRLVVLRKTRMPAVIAEIGFLTNSMEAEKLKTDNYRTKAAEALDKAVVRALKALDK